MSLPHLDIASFPSQIFWLGVASVTTYIFNKFFFVPAVSNSIIRRHKLIKENLQDAERMSQHIENLKTEINDLNTRTIKESKLIIENALKEAQTILMNQIQENNKFLNESVREYEKVIESKKYELLEAVPSIIDEVKDKVTKFISNTNIQQ